MDNVVKEIFDFYKSRIESPIFFSFLFSWLVINHEFAYYFIFYSGADKHSVMNGFSFDWWTDFFLPLMVSFSMIMILPVINNRVMEAKYILLLKFSGNVVHIKAEYDNYLESKRLQDMAKDLELRQSTLKVDMESYHHQRDQFYKNRDSLNEDLKRYEFAYSVLRKRANLANFPKISSLDMVFNENGQVVSFLLGDDDNLNNLNGAREYFMDEIYLDYNYYFEDIEAFKSSLENGKFVQLNQKNSSNAIKGFVKSIHK